jgi:hypothetical protein
MTEAATVFWQPTEMIKATLGAKIKRGKVRKRRKCSYLRNRNAFGARPWNGDDPNRPKVDSSSRYSSDL